LKRGEFVSMVGPSGCGKSTLLKVVAGLIRLQAGVTVAVDVAKRNAGLVSLMFQSPILLPWRDVFGNVVLAADLAGERRDPALIAKRADSLLRMVGLADFMHRYPFELSGGMQQRVALARALVLEPELMLLDEPFGALDALTREDMNFELQRLWLQSGATVLFVTHDIGEAVLLSDRVIVMSARPSRVISEVGIDLSRPRSANTRYHPQFLVAHQRISEALHGATPSRPVATASVVPPGREIARH
jgi:NitT/TauT family transport system ATP-binding protein